MSETADSGDVLDSVAIGEFELQTIKSDAIERVMPLTRPGLPEHMQGLIWMDQWGIQGGSNLGSKDLLLTVGPDFIHQTKARARPDLVMSFAGMPFETVGDTHVSVVPGNPTDVGNWSWFGILRDSSYLNDIATVHPHIYKFVFNADWTECFIVPPLQRSSVYKGQDDNLRLTMRYAGENVWHRITYLNPELTGETFHYTAHRIVDGKGNRLPKYADYLATANLPEVSGVTYPGSIMITRRPGATDNSHIVGTLPKTGAWPAWSDNITFDS